MGKNGLTVAASRQSEVWLTFLISFDDGCSRCFEPTSRAIWAMVVSGFSAVNLSPIIASRRSIIYRHVRRIYVNISRNRSTSHCQTIDGWFQETFRFSDEMMPGYRAVNLSWSIMSSRCNTLEMSWLRSRTLCCWMLLVGICSLIEKLLASMASAVVVSKAAPCRKLALVASAHIFQTTPNPLQAPWSCNVSFMN